MISFVQDVIGTLFPYVLSDYSAHGLIPVFRMVTTIVSALLFLPMAKVLDTFGRIYGLLVSIALIVLGLVIQAAAQNIAAFGAAHILYGIGRSFMGYVYLVLIADMTSLKNRSTCFPSFPSLFSSPASLTIRFRYIPMLEAMSA